jgi:acyl carrier protein
VSTPTVAELVRAYIVATRPPGKRGLGFADSTSLVATGIVDSVDVFELVNFLEDRFGIVVGDEDLEWKHFETVEAIARLVESKLEGVRP